MSNNILEDILNTSGTFIINNNTYPGTIFKQKTTFYYNCPLILTSKPIPLLTL